MRFAKEFEKVWKPAADGISAALLREQKETNAVSLKCAMDAFGQAKKSWSDPLQVQYSFLTSMENRAPECAEDFKAAWERFAFEEVAMPPLPNKLPYIAGIALMAAAGGVVSSLLPANSFLPALIGRNPVIILGAAVFAVIGAGLFRSLWCAKAEEVRKNCTELYISQLQPLHDELVKICEKTEKA